MYARSAAMFMTMPQKKFRSATFPIPGNVRFAALQNLILSRKPRNRRQQNLRYRGTRKRS